MSSAAPRAASATAARCCSTRSCTCICSTPAGELYLQRRPDWKDIQPGRWDTAVGGHVAYGETVEEALRREVREEIGVTEFTPERIAVYAFRSEREYELVYVHRTCYDGTVCPSDELDGGRFWSREEILGSVGKGIFTPNFEGEIGLLFP